MADEFQDLQSLACEDCIADIQLGWHRGIADEMFGFRSSRATVLESGPTAEVAALGDCALDRVLFASVRHEDTCPWLARFAPQGATLSGVHGILMHWSNATADPPKAGADER